MCKFIICLKCLPLSSSTFIFAVPFAKLENDSHIYFVANRCTTKCSTVVDIRWHSRSCLVYYLWWFDSNGFAGATGNEAGNLMKCKFLFNFLSNSCFCFNAQKGLLWFAKAATTNALQIGRTKASLWTHSSSVLHLFVCHSIRHQHYEVISTHIRSFLFQSNYVFLKVLIVCFLRFYGPPICTFPGHRTRMT